MLAAGCLFVMHAAADDQSQVRALVEQGRILPLAELLDRLPADRSGRVLEVELEEHRGMLIYEIEILDEQDRVWELKLDAQTGRLLEREREHD